MTNHQVYWPSFVPIFGTCLIFLLDVLMELELSRGEKSANEEYEREFFEWIYFIFRSF